MYVFAASRTAGLLVLVWKNIFALHSKLIFHFFYIHVWLHPDHLSTATPSLWKCSSLPRFGGKLTVGSCACTCNHFKTWDCFEIANFPTKKLTVGSCACTCNVFKTLYFSCFGIARQFSKRILTSIWKCFGIANFPTKKSKQVFSHTLKVRISECWILPCSLRSPSSPQIPIQTWKVSVIIKCNNSFSIDVFVDNFTF